MTLCNRPTFRPKDLLLHCSEVDKLVFSRWHVNATCYVIYRIVLAVYSLSVWIYTIVNKPKFSFIYLTNWGFTALTLNFIIKAVISVKYFQWLKADKILSKDGEIACDITQCSSHKVQDLWLLKLSWLLTNISTSVGLVITVIYWSILFPAKKEFADPAENIQVHAINSVLLLLDLCLVALPFRMVHVYQPLLYSLAYITFSGIYWASGGVARDGKRAIYPITKWDRWEILLVLLGFIICLSFIQSLLVLLTWYLDRVASKREGIKIVSYSLTEINKL